jgi:hypothetical protein
MGATAAEAPLRLPAAPPLAFCCYTSVLLLFAFSVPGSRASNQPPGGGGGGGDCPGGKGKSINCSGRTGRSPPVVPTLFPFSPSFLPLLSSSPRAPCCRVPPGSVEVPGAEGGGQSASARCRVGHRRSGWVGSGRACVRGCRVAGRGRPLAD